MDTFVSAFRSRRDCELLTEKRRQMEKLIVVAVWASMVIGLASESARATKLTANV
jgi:hypothetical protein